MRLRSGRQRDVPFTCEQSGGGIETHPARARQIHFRPSMQIGEVFPRTLRAFQRFHVGFELNQIAGDEPRCVTQLA